MGVFPSQHWRSDIARAFNPLRWLLTCVGAVFHHLVGVATTVFILACNPLQRQLGYLYDWHDLGWIECPEAAAWTVQWAQTP